MSQYAVNSEIALQTLIGDVRELWRVHRYLKVKVTTGKVRSLDQNAISHTWYEQVARELREESARDVKRYCKLHHGVPILRADDAEFREAYDGTLKLLTYAQKLVCMDWMPVTSVMTKTQLSAYLTAMQDDFNPRGVVLEFPKDEAA